MKKSVRRLCSVALCAFLVVCMACPAFAAGDSDADPDPEPVVEIMSVSSLMDDIGGVFSGAIDMVGTVAETVVSNPILYLPIVIGLCGIGVAFFKRLKQ